MKHIRKTFQKIITLCLAAAILFSAVPNVYAEENDAGYPRAKECTITLSKTSVIYNGTAQTPSVTIKAPDGKKIPHRYYTLTYEKNKRPGKALVRIKFNAPYKGTAVRTFFINGFLKKNGKLRYLLNNKKAKNRFVEHKGNTYYVDKNGERMRGWMHKSGHYYYFDRSNGILQKGGKADGIKLNKDGTAKESAYNVEKIKTMITARSIMQQVTDPSDTPSQKLKKVFQWVMDFPYHRYRKLKEEKSKNPGWEMTFANDVYEHGQGCCVSEACAFAFLAHECGYKEVFICDDTGHAFTMIDGYYYDTLFAVSDYGSYYKGTKQTAKKDFLVNQKKI